MSRLTPADVYAIIKSRDSLAKLANHYHVSKSTIANIKKGRTYANPDVCPTCGRSYEGDSLAP